MGLFNAKPSDFTSSVKASTENDSSPHPVGPMEHSIDPSPMARSNAGFSDLRRSNAIESGSTAGSISRSSASHKGDLIGGKTADGSSGSDGDNGSVSEIYPHHSASNYEFDNDSLSIMGAQFSALKQDILEIMPKSADSLLHKLHVAGHYAVIPAIYVIGLIHANEFTWNPLELIEKVFVA